MQEAQSTQPNNAPDQVCVDTVAWYCIRTHPKHEHIAAARLGEIEGVVIYAPQVRLRKNTRRGMVWFKESLFPNYVFARFDLATLLSEVRHAFGVGGVVHFGDRYPIIPDAQVDDLRRSMGGTEQCELVDELRAGDEVEIADKAFGGLAAVVIKSLPARQRVQVLMEILGRSTVVEVSVANVIAVNHRPVRVQVVGAECAAA